MESWTPVVVSNLTNATAVVSGSGEVFACALRSDGTVSCWGDNSAGELGNGTIGTVASTPGPVSGLTGVRSIVAGPQKVMAILADGTLAAWGASRCVGNGTATDSLIPVVVPGLSHVVGAAAGRCHACALLDDGTVECWGDTSSTPVRVAL
jgi:alpha-tubulin suppressor-like RCC1 family protein